MNAVHRKDLDEAISNFRDKVRADNEVRMMFLSREHDDEFRAVGMLAFVDRFIDLIDDHIIVWEGYEHAMGLKMIEQ